MYLLGLATVCDTDSLSYVIVSRIQLLQNTYSTCWGRSSRDQGVIVSPLTNEWWVLGSRYLCTV